MKAEEFKSRLSERKLRTDLEPVKEALSRWNNFDFSIVQVVGSNGKGTVVHLLEKALNKLGRATVSCTSPHLITPTERVKYNTRPLNNSDFYGTLSELDRQTGQSLTSFELLFLLAVREAIEKNVDYLLLEAGMGGRWDATSALSADWTVCTGVELEHTEYLGTTREEILSELTAQIASESGLIVPKLETELSDYIRKQARKRNLKLKEVEPTEPVLAQNRQLAANTLNVLDEVQLTPAVELLEKIEPPPGRQTLLLQNERSYFLDVAHTPAAVEAALKARPVQDEGKWYTAFGCLQGKRAAEMINIITEDCSANRLFLTAPPSPRKMALAKLVDHAPPGAKSSEAEELNQLFLNLSEPGDGLTVIGSFSLVALFYNK